MSDDMTEIYAKIARDIRRETRVEDLEKRAGAIEDKFNDLVAESKASLDAHLDQVAKRCKAHEDETHDRIDELALNIVDQLSTVWTEKFNALESNMAASIAKENMALMQKFSDQIETLKGIVPDRSTVQGIARKEARAEIEDRQTRHRGSMRYWLYVIGSMIPIASLIATIAIWVFNNPLA